MDNFLVGYACRLKPRDFVIKTENFSSNRRGKRQYLNKTMTNEFIRELNLYLRTRVEMPRMKVGNKQEIETLISEEVLLFAKYLRNERQIWDPRILKLGSRARV